MDYTALKAEITTDPKALGYASYVAAGDTVTLAALINAATGAGAGPVTLSQISRGALLKAVIPLTDQLASGTGTDGLAIPAAIVSKWQYRFQALQAGDPLIALDAQLLGMLTQSVTDKLTTVAYVATINARTGSRAEVLFGAGVIVNADDIARAL